jgi:hypothetical protein
MTAARIGVFVLLAVAIAVAANLALLRVATGPRDPVGRLTPQAGLVRLPSPPSAPVHPRDDRSGSSQDD